VAILFDRCGKVIERCNKTFRVAAHVAVMKKSKTRVSVSTNGFAALKQTRLPSVRFSIKITSWRRISPTTAAEISLPIRTLQNSLRRERVNCSEIIRSLRMRRARRLLATTEKPLAEASLRAGYSDVSNFRH
jgi:hypothetical protein